MKALSAHATIEELVRSTDLYKPSEIKRNFSYELNKKAAKNKLIKGCKRTSIQVEENKI